MISNSQELDWRKYSLTSIISAGPIGVTVSGAETPAPFDEKSFALHVGVS
jgi:hypothetical protein